MTTVTLPKVKYLELKERAEAFDRMIAGVNPSLFFIPTEKSRKKIVSGFSRTGLYNKNFLNSLARGIKRSPFFTD